MVLQSFPWFSLGQSAKTRCLNQIEFHVSVITSKHNSEETRTWAHLSTNSQRAEASFSILINDGMSFSCYIFPEVAQCNDLLGEFKCIWRYSVVKGWEEEGIRGNRWSITCSGAPLLTRCQLPSGSIYVIAVRFSTGLNGKKCTSVMLALACKVK